ncbi:putative metallophosphoesterase [Salinivirga cyanobacteriivorans]|uniref:Putative metallophosphoesterase n=1 Tax=Salinivirga cyanobacteriivorans TaxID=1307839 RepID=A0A0S2HVB3_9BACT|nr:metallophosphoesterase [Salinivirga cyanobacteriivorans]ALO13976.1 putative metallophosphoesterase [Salinivirga cyanobacteriivorans]
MRLYAGLFSIAIFIFLIDIIFFLFFLRRTKNKKLWLGISLGLGVLYSSFWLWLFLTSPESYSYLQEDNYPLFFLATSIMIILYIPRLIAIIFRLILFPVQIAHLLNRKKAHIISLSLAAVFFIISLFGIFVIRFQFRVIEQTIESQHIPQSFDGYRIAQISDLHLGTSDRFKQSFNKMVERINELDVDVVFFTGDIVNNFATELDGWQPILNKIKSSDGTFAILGNHDYGDYVKWESSNDKQQNFRDVIAFFDDINWKLLKNEYTYLTRRKDSIILSGVENWGHPPFPQYGDLNKSLPDTINKPVLLLSHDPSHWDAEVKNHEAPIFLTLAGHTHGFQFGIRSEAFNWSPVKLRYDKWGGLYQQKDKYLYVNVGAGTIGFPGRIGMRPEITLITLKSK